MAERAYKHVIVIGVDGMGNFNKAAETPRMDEIFANGATTYNALSMDPTISAQNWGGMLLGCFPLVHGLTNSIVSDCLYENEAMPSVFKRIRAAYPDAALASYCNWDPINHGIIEHDIGVDMQTAAKDDILTDMIIKKLADRPDFFFIQLDNVDGAGHRHGYGTEGHLRQIELTDGYIGRIYDEYVRLGMIADTLFIVTADHGGFDRGHGGYTDGEKYVFLGAAGKGVANGKIGTAYTQDISAIVLHAFGLDVPAYKEGGYTSQVPSGLFTDHTDAYIMPEIQVCARRAEETAYDAEGGIGVKLGGRTALCAFFEGKLKDESGNCSFTEYGTFKYYSNGFLGSCGEAGANGCAVIEGLRTGENGFAAGIWLDAKNAGLSDTVVLSSAEHADDDAYDGWTLFTSSHRFTFKAVHGGERLYAEIPFEDRTIEGWAHALVNIVLSARRIDFYRNFRLVHTQELTEELSKAFRFDSLTLGNDVAREYNSGERVLTSRFDDLLLFNEPLCAKDIDILRKMYLP